MLMFGKMSVGVRSADDQDQHRHHDEGIWPPQREPDDSDHGLLPK
jgi:hypothetical protein